MKLIICIMHKGSEYLVLWKGFTNEDSSWIKGSDLNWLQKGTYVSHTSIKNAFTFFNSRAFNILNQG